MLVCAFLVFSIAYAHGFRAYTTEGIVEGSKAADGDYFAFYGIPYAGPTSGANRFKAPGPPASYKLLPANNSNIFCAQPTSRGLVGTENCLTLNIFTSNKTEPKPVIVWLNADEYTNSNTQIPSVLRLIEQNVVFVQMNFRLSIFGFLCLRIQEAPGNAGLKDVIQGLKWIKNNIHSFKGDPNNVILMGHASGAAMVDLLTLSPQIKDLAHKAIVLSGSSLAPWAVAYDPIGYAERLGNKLGYDGKNLAKLAKHLVDTDINVLHTALNEFKFVNNTALFAPCLEDPKISGNDTVLTEAPIDAIRAGNYAHIPVIYGYTNREGTMRAEEADFGNWLTFMQTNFTRFLPVDLKFGKNKTAIVASIRDFYFSNSTISMAVIEDYLEYQGDTLVLISSIKTAKERAFTSKGEVRLLELAYLGTKNSHWIHNQIPLSGASHGAFLNYLFVDDLRTEDDVVSRSLVQRFTAFAHNWTNGNLNISRSASWAPITKDVTNYLYYGGNGGPTINNLKIYVEESRFDPHFQRTMFWKNLYDQYYSAPAKPSSSSVMLSSIFFVMLCQLFIRLF
ncbi:hypothetical protein PYW08_005479 [Mythimna loreyi]|uniref:Uncharacterized protein n=1 Tax=Mythimna loreyi TaxID=667449 RepID=A0ACC2QKQ9_9NEOP|nr:hypothetical protein PYW08_005479 [Mythimna loreyi]